MKSSGWKFEDVHLSNYSILYENPTTVLTYYSTSSYPNGNFITYVNDLSLHLTELIKGYNGNGTILNKENYKSLFTHQLNARNFSYRNVQNPYSQGYNAGIYMGFGHTGGDPGVSAIMFFNPKNNIGRILITNTNFGYKMGNDIFY